MIAIDIAIIIATPAFVLIYALTLCWLEHILIFCAGAAATQTSRSTS